MQIKLGKYRHYKGNEYELLSVATHSETLEPLAVYKALYGEGGVWVRPLSMWQETVVVNGESVPRFAYIGTETTVFHLQSEPFFQMKSGEKTVELRLYDEKRRAIKVGEEIAFHLQGGEEKISARVEALHIFPNFSALFATDLYKKTGFLGVSKEEALAKMHAFFSGEDEEKFGVVGIEIKVH